MTMRPITEDDLHGFVDQRLEPKRLAEVRAYLDEHPEIAARISGFGQQRDMLRAALAPIAEEPLPSQLNLARMIEIQQRPRGVPWWASAAAAPTTKSTPCRWADTSRWRARFPARRSPTIPAS